MVGVSIRPCRPDDVDAICAAVMESREELSPWMSWCHDAYSRDDAAEWVAGRPGAWERNESWSFVIVDASDRLLGTCDLHRLDLRHGVGEIGYWVRTSATGKGIASEATRQLCAWAFREQNVHRIELLTAIANLKSQRVAEKVGAVKEGRLKERLLIRGERQDCYLYAILNAGS